MKTICHLFILLWTSSFCYSQDSLFVDQLIDSALTAQTREDGLKLFDEAFKKATEIDYYNGLVNSRSKAAVFLARRGEFTEAIELLHSTIKSEEYKNEALSIFYNQIGVYNAYIGQFDSTEYYFEKTLQVRLMMEDSIGIAASYNNLGTLNISKGNLEKATSYLTNALRIRNQISDSSGIASTTNNLGLVFYKREMYREAIDNYLIALSINQDFNDKSREGMILLNLGNSYDELEKYDTAKTYYQKALSIAMEIQDARLESMSSGNLGVTEIRLGNLDKARQLFKSALAIRRASDDLPGIAEILNEMGTLQIETGEYKAAIASFQESAEIAKEIEAKEIERENKLGLSVAYARLGNYQRAFESHQRYVALKDTILNEENQASINELITQYETEKKEQQIALQDAEIAEKEAQLERNQILLIASIMLIVLIISLALLQRSRIRKKQQLKLQEARLHAREAEINATISSQEKERARYARDLHDGFGQMISILNMNLSNLKKDAKPEERQEVFEASEKLIDEMYGELKSICFDLMPQTLVKSGLKNGIDEFASRINQSNKVSVETNFFGLDDRLSEIQEISLYRITQEWVNNIIKYSDADKVTIQLTKDDDEITLLIEDNGFGFEKSNLTDSKGNGWKNLNTRTKLIKGELELETQSGIKGNTLIVNAPTTVETSQEETSVSLV